MPLDINECNTNNGGCNQTCSNTVGSRTCACGAGYTLATDGADCDGKFVLAVVLHPNGNVNSFLLRTPLNHH